MTRLSGKPDISLVREKLGWEPKVRLKEGLAPTIEYFEGLLREGRGEGPLRGEQQ